MPVRESLAEILESMDEAYDESDWGEARGSRPLPLRQPQGGGYAQPRPSPSPVTQTQLQAALARVAKDVQTNAEGIKALNVRAAEIGAQFEKHATVVKKELGEVRGSAKSAREMMILPFLLQTPPRINAPTVTALPDGTLPAGTTVVHEVTVAPTSQMNTMLPLLLLMGSSGDGSKGSGGGDDMMMLALVMMMAQQPR
jgi:hypothetical protein